MRDEVDDQADTAGDEDVEDDPPGRRRAFEVAGLFLAGAAYRDHVVRARREVKRRRCDAGVLAIDSTRFSYKTGPDHPLIGLDGFRGDFALTTGLLLPVNSKHPASVRLRGDGGRFLTTSCRNQSASIC